MINICKDKCCGCGACYSICPTNAISMIENRKGFLEPIIDYSRCVKCGKCIKVCGTVTKEDKIKKCYIVKLKNILELLNSQSGGAFTAISDVILKEQGIVYGVSWNNNFEAEYIRGENYEQRNKMRGSKYMQAKINDIFVSVKKDLTNHKKVLFSGTPCHVAGLKKYLSNFNIDISGLYCVDVICHGTPSVKIWRSTLKYFTKKIGHISHVICRDKLSNGWGSSETTFYASKKKCDNIYCKIFFTDLILCDSCYSCKYTKIERVGDISIGDAWGVKENNPEFYDCKGVSMLTVNTSKGNELFDLFSGDIFYEEVDLNKYLQKNLQIPSKPHRNIDEFWKDYEKRSFKYIIAKYGKNNILLNYKYILKKGINILCRKK